MSWAEVLKINKNTKKALNEQLRDMRFLPMRIITSSTTYTPEKTGIYKVICVGAGGRNYIAHASNYHKASAGAAGGVAIKTMTLSSSTSYNVTVGTTASFSTILTATSGSVDEKGGVGGTATGGDYNFPGGKGEWTSLSDEQTCKGGSVGISLSELSRYINTSVFMRDGTIELTYGDSILTYGGGAPSVIHYAFSETGTSPGWQTVAINGLPAAVIIIPLEMEE